MPLSSAETRALLESLDHRPKRKLGQNFLTDGNIVRKSLEMAEVAPGEAVVEIGPGLGTLTRALLDGGAEVWAVERDPALFRHLEREFAPGPGKRLHLCEGDAVAIPLAGLPAQPASRAFKIVANLPYAVASPWMEAVLAGPLPRRMVLMLQKEAADRYVAGPGGKSFGAISIFLQAAFETTGRHRVSASCFHPRPQVDSVLLRLDCRGQPAVLDPVPRKWIRELFTQRRKQLGALCREHPDRRLLNWFDQAVAGRGLRSVRAEDLPLEAWLEMPRYL